MIAEAVTLLPEPLSPRIDQRLAGVDMQADVADDLDRTVLGLEGDAEVLRPREDAALIGALRRLPWRRQRCCGSLAIRAQLASRFSDSVVSMIIRPGQNDSHHAVCR